MLCNGYSVKCHTRCQAAKFHCKRVNTVQGPPPTPPPPQVQVRKKRIGLKQYSAQRFRNNPECIPVPEQGQSKAPNSPSVLSGQGPASCSGLVRRKANARSNNNSNKIILALGKSNTHFWRVSWC